VESKSPTRESGGLGSPGPSHCRYRAQGLKPSRPRTPHVGSEERANHDRGVRDVQLGLVIAGIVKPRKSTTFPKRMRSTRLLIAPPRISARPTPDF
jgi:hypothetical protein